MTRVVLEPLREEHAEEMALVLGDPRLYEYTGGQPMSAHELLSLYQRQIAGPSDERGEQWLNWIVRRVDDDVAIGFVQATVSGEAQGEADIAWVIGMPWQGRGYATEAGLAMVQLLKASGVTKLNAHIHPRHRASAKVAKRLGLTATTEVDPDGEVIWRRDVGGPIGGATRPGASTA